MRPPRSRRSAQTRQVPNQRAQNQRTRCQRTQIRRAPKHLMPILQLPARRPTPDMTAGPSSMTDDIDFTALGFESSDPSFIADPYPVYSRMRELGPVLYYPPRGVYLFQAYDDIRDDKVTGVQTCALPI